ncbi:unnamed protein product [marine sediment metagenome]|uniref:Uncharacterized protein n=1 Tax=marine sediment metagenome TaxID=412755 RepID=X1CWU3_9ZZZZ
MAEILNLGFFPFKISNNFNFFVQIFLNKIMVVLLLDFDLRVDNYQILI